MDNQTDIGWLSATQMATALSSGDITAARLVEEHLERIKNHDAHLHAYVSVYQEDALNAARAADLARQAGHATGPLHGVPVAVKDIVDIENRITTGGSKVWENRVSAHTATLVQRMLAEGMIVLGKTHTVEFAMGSWGTNQHMGHPRNPWHNHQHRAAGGSSSGSAVAVAAGLAPWAIGTDTGGSVRIPSAFCGLTGLKTTIGRISCFGVLPLSTTLDTPGPMCRSVEDAALLYTVLQGADIRDPISTQLPPDDPLPTLDHGIKGMRFAVISQTERSVCDAQIINSYDAAIDVLADLGADIAEVELPQSFSDMGNIVGEIIGAEGYSFVGDLVDDPYKAIDADIRPRIQIGKNMTAHHYLGLLRQRDHIKEQMSQALSDVDALLTPTTTQLAPVVTDIDQDTTAAHFTRAVNLIEYCALTLPSGYASNSLPCSLQIVCRGGDESLALRIGQAFQTATQWHQRHPDV